MRAAIAAAMARSKREIPHYYLATDVDMTRALAWLEAHNRELPDRGAPAPGRAAARRDRARGRASVPELNGFCRRTARSARAEHVHLGVAIALRGGGLIAPAILDADRATPAELMARLRDLVARARRGGLRGSEIAEPTITVTSLGDQGVSASTA